MIFLAATFPGNQRAKVRQKVSPKICFVFAGVSEEFVFFLALGDYVHEKVQKTNAAPFGVFLRRTLFRSPMTSQIYQAREDFCRNPRGNSPNKLADEFWKGFVGSGCHKRSAAKGA